MNHSPHNFPVAALPAGLCAPLDEAAKNMKAPLPMLASALLSVASSATQGLLNVRRPNGLSGPVSLMFLTIAESGERKTACDEIYSHGIKQFERVELAAEMTRASLFDAERIVWEEKAAILKAAIAKAIKKSLTSSGSSIEDLQNQLAAHLLHAPSRPRTLQMFLQDATPEGIVNRVQQHCPLLFLSCDEGGKVMNANMAHSLPLLNSMRDGSAQYFDRKTSGRQIIPFVRLSSHVQVQPNTMARFIEKSGSLSRDIGFLARNLVCFPHSTQGFRFIDNFDELKWPCVVKFNERVIELLEETKKTHQGTVETLPEVEFSSEAAHAWVRYFNHVEINQQPNGCYSGIRDAASKIAENVARLAGVIHKFEGHQGQISLDTIERSIAIGDWYLQSFRMIFDPPAVPQVALDAQSLEAWLWKHYRQTGEWVFKKNFVRQHGPLRSKSELDAAVAMLTNAGRMSVYRIGKTAVVSLRIPQALPPGHV